MLAQLDMPVMLSQLLPELILIVAGCGLLLLGTASKEALRRCVPVAALGAVVAACVVLVVTTPVAGSIGGGLRIDGISGFVRNTTLIMAVLLILIGWTQPSLAERGEYFAMMLFSLAGLMLTSLCDNLIMLFLSLELVSIPTYVLVTLSRTSSRSLEAGTKYFYLGAMSAAIMAFGMSYLYGATGTASLNASISAAMNPEDPAFAIASIGLVLTLAGLMFKIAAVPLHFYIADVYQGAAGPVAGFLGFVPKLAGFVAIFKIISLTDWIPSDAMFWTLWIVAAASMTVGNVLALMQTNIRRMLAYSGIAHSGYMLVAVLAGPGTGESGGIRDGFAAVLYYSVIYGIANLGAFAVLALLRVRGRPAETLRDLAGLLRRSPGPALLMALIMFTLMGLPPTPGFWGKMSLFGSALSAAPLTPYPGWMIGLVIVALVNSAVAAAYYLRVIAACLLYENDRPATAAPRELLRLGAAACGFLLLIFAFFPGILLKAGRDATRDYRDGFVAAGTDAAPESAARLSEPAASDATGTE